MTPPRGAPLCLLAASLTLLAWAASSAAEAGDAKDQPNLTFVARAEPAQVAPGGEGVVVLDVKVLAHVHVYAEAKMFKVATYAAKGVTYGKPALSPPKSWKDPGDPEGDPVDVWFDKIEVRIPFTLSPDAALPVRVGADVTWSCCNEDICFPPEKTKEPVLAEVKAPPGWHPAAAPANGGQPGARTTAPLPSVPANGNGPGPAAPAGPTERVVEVDDEVTKVLIRVLRAEVRLRFEPKAGFHLYAPGSPDGIPIRAAGTAAPGIAWKEAAWPVIDGHDITVPYEVVLAYEAKAPEKDPFAAEISWQGCSESGCKSPQERVVLFDAEKAWVEMPKTKSASASATVAVPESGLLFPVVGDAKPKSKIDDLWDSLGLLMLGPVFLFGVALAFTPCVLPLIPITVSIIGGGKADLPRSRLTFLLSFYVLGLCLAFGSMGIISALTGSAISAVFQSPVAIRVIAGVFGLLSLGMFGIFEMQPPEWMQRLQGGAKGGNVVGAFLFGAMAALIASPCTGPFIAGMVVFTAQSGNILLGFVMFAVLGLGMGAVLFAAGSLNLLMRPGPWMVWVRHGFGILLTGIALYYLASSGLLLPPWLFVVGFGWAVAVAALIVRHLVQGQGAVVLDAAKQGAVVAVFLALVTGGVAWVTREPSLEGSGGEILAWTTVRDRAALVAEVERAKREGKAAVVDIWAQWCTYCKAYDRVIAGDPALRAGFAKLHRLRIDKTEPVPGERGMRDGIGVLPDGQPLMVFIDAKGRIQRSLDVKEWLHGDSASELQKRLKALEAVP